MHCETTEALVMDEFEMLNPVCPDTTHVKFEFMQLSQFNEIYIKYIYS